jgi:alginate O-acetyltransferase complex protein AlgI
MFITDFFYWFFVAVALIGYYIVPVRARPFVLAAAGIAFYSLYARPFVLLIGAELLLVYALVRGQKIRSSKPLFVSVLLLAIAVLVYYKYSGMLSETVNALLQLFDFNGLPRLENLLIPLALSYITFELIHYIVEMRRGTLPEHRLQHFLSFSFFFPTLVAGPIKQFQKFLPELSNPFAARNLLAGSGRIVIGLFKKLVLADTINLLVQPLNSGQGMMNTEPGLLWLALIAYSFVIYFDFSGYSDIAIGTAKLFGITIPENFRFPYASRSIAEFWNRWHISLGRWLTQYVYFPLGGSRATQLRTSFNLIATLGVSGLWHGASWHFVVWGLSHGVMLAIHRLYAKKLKPYVTIPKWLKPATGTLAVAGTFGFVVVTRVFFILPLYEAWVLLGRLFAW